MAKSPVRKDSCAVAAVLILYGIFSGGCVPSAEPNGGDPSESDTKGTGSEALVTDNENTADGGDDGYPALETGLNRGARGLVPRG